MRAHRLLVVATGINALVMAVSLTQANRLSAAGDPDTVRARAIELVDQQGRVRAQLKVEPDGEAVFRLRDTRGEVRVKLGAGGDGSGLVLLDGATEPGIRMLAKDSGTSLTLTSRSGQRRVIVP